jgi:hypothetical protein
MSASLSLLTHNFYLLLSSQAVAILCQHPPTVADISIAHEPLVLTRSDMNASNFGVDAAGRPVILDFAVLPCTAIPSLL